MDQWEYKVVRKWWDTKHKAWTPDGRDHFYVSLEDILAPWGVQGWELVSVAPHHAVGQNMNYDFDVEAYHAYFKRRKA